MSNMPLITPRYRRFSSILDYPLMAPVWNAAYTFASRSDAEWWGRDKYLKTDPARQIWLAEAADEELVGVAGFENLGVEGYPRHYLAYVTVLEHCRNEGLGNALYEKIETDLAGLDKESLWLWTRADYAAAHRFLAKRGFTELYRMSFMRLFIDRVNTHMLEDYTRELVAEGYEFKNFHELAGDKDRDIRFYRLYCEVKHSIPSPLTRKLPDADTFCAKIKDTPDYFNGCFVAVYQGEYVGLGLLEERNNPQRELYTDSLGVAGVHRRRGVALGIVLCGVLYAKSIGSQYISEDNYVGNDKVKPLLEKIGFVPEPDWILYEKRF
jgi:GNAT superfamily N-acetyltransferase